MNQRTKRLLALASGTIAIAMLSGCAITKDYIPIDYTPLANAPRVAGADHVSVQVEMVDVRAIHDRVGNKDNGYGMQMAAIIATNDVVVVVQHAIEAELANHGFKLAGGDVTVLVEFSKFYNEFRAGFWSGDAVAELTMSVQIKKPDGNIIYSKLVTGEGEKEKIQLASGKNAEAALEAALQNSMLRLFADPLFIDGLVKASGHQP